MSELFEFYKDEENPLSISKPTYKIIIADDEHDVHVTTKLVLRDFQLDDHVLSFISAYNMADIKKALNEHTDAAVILLDVVMDHSDTGLAIVDYIRNELDNSMIRIILRTGQPGDAPEESVVAGYDINDYLLKTEVSVQRLFTSMYQALRSYRDLNKIEVSRMGLEKIVRNSSKLFVKQSLEAFFSGILRILADLHLDSSTVCFTNRSYDASFACVGSIQESHVVAATGNFEMYLGNKISEMPIYSDLVQYIGQVDFYNKASVIEVDFGGFLIWCHTGPDQLAFIYSETKISDYDLELLNLFMVNYALALEGFMLNQELNKVQHEIINRLGNVIETRSNETGHHVYRMSKVCEILAENMDIEPSHKKWIGAAASVHDVGKIGIDQDILMKPGRLNDAEFEIIKHHSEIGYEIFKDSKLDILKDAALICLHHHERYDGSGYPKGLKGEEIPLVARIVSVADVFDALTHKRIYKDAWTVENALIYMKEEKGHHFDPDVVDCLEENIDDVVAIMKQYDEP